MKAFVVKITFGLVLSLIVGITQAQTAPNVVVVPLGGELSASQFNDFVARVTDLETNRPFVKEGPA